LNAQGLALSVAGSCRTPANKGSIDACFAVIEAAGKLLAMCPFRGYHDYPVNPEWKIIHFPALQVDLLRL